MNSARLDDGVEFISGSVSIANGMDEKSPCQTLFQKTFDAPRSTAPTLLLCEMFADLPRPCRHNGTCCGKGTGHVRQRREVLAHPRRITSELDSVFGADAKTTRDLHRVDVRAEEDELPALRFLPLHHRPHLICRIPRARVLHAVCRDDEHRARGAILGTRILVHVLDVTDAIAHRIEQSRAASCVVLSFDVSVGTSAIRTRS